MTDSLTGRPQWIVVEPMWRGTQAKGVILSPGASVNLDNPTDKQLNQRVTAESKVMLRRFVAPGLLRRQQFVSLRKSAEHFARLWADGYSVEARWLTDDLHQRGCSLDRMRR
jgi:hypothetical protein